MKADPWSSVKSLVVVALFAVAWVAALPAVAQEEPVEEAAAESAGPAEATSTEPSAPPSQAERLIRIERVIRDDKEKLAEIKEDLAGREAFFDRLAGQIESGEKRIAEKKLRLEELGGPDASEEAAALATEIENGETLLDAARKQSEITFQSAKTLKQQIQALEKKIAEEEQALLDLAGPAAEDLDTDEPESREPAAKPAEATAPLPGQQLLPGVVQPSGEETGEAVQSQPETAEQIEARREADQAEEEARRAEAAVVSFVERKRSLEDQIEIEKQLLDTARESRTNLDAAMDSARAEASRLIAEDASQAEIRQAQETLATIDDLRLENRNEIDRRRAYLDSLRERLQELQEEQLAVTQEAEAKRVEAEKARKRSIWLESPLHPTNLWQWVSTRGPRMLLVIALAWVLLALVRWSARGIAKTIVGATRDEQARGAKRADTLALSFRSAMSLFIVVAAVLLVFQEAGVDIKTVLGGAAILGVALAFGAQNLMRDYFTGFMILLEDQYELGDLITVGAITGVVEKVNMRTTVLRDLEGRVHFIPNGEIKSVTNRTYVWGRAVLDIPIDFKEDVDRAMAVILEVAEEFRADPDCGDWVTDDPVMLGVDKFTEQGVIIKFMIQTKPAKIFPTRRELLRRVKKKFDEEGIRISVPHRILIQQVEP